MSKIHYPAPAERLSQTQELCSCIPPGLITRAEFSANEAQEAWEETIPLAPVLNELLRTALANYFPRSLPFSLLLLHITQFEYAQVPLTLPLIHKRLNCHAPASFLSQVIDPIRRALRTSDLALLDEHGSGAALLFPQVDQVGIACIAERISRSINLLQAETVVPPLRQQTEIVLGAGSYPELSSSPEDLLIQASQVRERIVFRPAVLPDALLLRSRTTRARGTTRRGAIQGERMRATRPQGVPFMQIPTRLPTRLQQLVPYSLALELRCAPVGRDHNRLTVAMADPADTRAICYLRDITGMTIFPVSCELVALETLLASKW